MEIFEQLFCTFVEIEVKGQEKAAFTRYYWVREGDNNVERSERVKAINKFTHYKQPVFQVPGGFLQPGVYAISFQFILPNAIPSSINFKERETRHWCKAKIKYFVKTTVHTVEKKHEMKYKQVLAIR